MDFLNEISILVFAELAIFNAISMRPSSGKIVGKSLSKTYDT